MALKIKSSKLKLSIIFIIILLALGVYFYLQNSRRDINEKEKVSELSTWVVDWDMQDGFEELNSISGVVSSVGMFGVYFDENNKLYVSDKTKDMLNKIENNKPYKTYLTIVNDKFYSKEKVVQKDAKLVDTLLETKESRKEHIDSIVKLVLDTGLDGIEIDYENISNKTWKDFSVFCEELYSSLIKVNKSLKVVLEAKSPIEKISLPSGPTYVMMAYNLYGYHSGAGPKADKNLIEKLCKKMDNIKSDKYISLSLGGFDWEEGGKVKSLTEIEAKNLYKKNGTKLKRDGDSSSLYFEYLDEKQNKHTVWYSDSETIDNWISISNDSGYNKIALWRLGGVSKETLEKLKYEDR